MQEYIPISENTFVLYDYETEEYVPIIYNLREIQMWVLEDLCNYNSDRLGGVLVKITTTPTFKQLALLRKKIAEIVDSDIVEIYIMNDCIKIQLPEKVRTDQLNQIDEIFGMHGEIEMARHSICSILEYRVDQTTTFKYNEK